MAIMGINKVQENINNLILSYKFILNYDFVTNHRRSFITLDEGEELFIHFNKQYIIWYHNKEMMLIIDRENRALFVCYEEADFQADYLVDFCEYYSRAYTKTYYYSSDIKEEEKR